MRSLFVVVALSSLINSCSGNNNKTQKNETTTISELNDQEWKQLMSDLSISVMNRDYFEKIFNSKCTETNDFIPCIKEEILLEIERWTQKDPIDTVVFEWLSREHKKLCQLYSLGADAHALNLLTIEDIDGLFKVNAEGWYNDAHGIPDTTMSE